MPHFSVARQSIAEIGAAFYQTHLRAQVKTPENIGKIIAIDFETGDYRIGEDLIELASELRKERSDAKLWAERIGYDAVYAVGGMRIRTEA